MGLSQKLKLRQGQTQSLVMTPQLSQSIKLLAMSNIELDAFIDEQLEKNPFLERAENGADDRRSDVPESTSSNEREPLSALSLELDVSAQTLADNLGTSLENVFPDEQDYRNDRTSVGNEDKSASVSGGLAISSASSSDDWDIAERATTAPSLHDHLHEQLSLMRCELKVRFFVQTMIEFVDDGGYLQLDLLALTERLDSTEEVANTAIDLLQSMDPCGVGARDLRECLTLQLRERGRFDPAMASLIDNLPLLARRDYAALAKLSGLDASDMRAAVLEIQALDPKPGTAFSSQATQHVAPDAEVREASDGSWIVELNSETLPRVLVNETYLTRVDRDCAKGARPTEAHEFVQQCAADANWLTRSLDQRANTILKVCKSIVSRQDAFLIHGIDHLRPMTLKQVAEDISMHESSVSRATSNKYLMTPRGLFEMKYFFTTALGATEGDDGSGHSAEAVRAQIRTLIDAETARTVLSDDAIVEALRGRGVDIARRTVAKYRDAMAIPSSVQRRREKRAIEQAG
nr:RNA polymerase factor sigma-54 [Ahrensia sp. R2A130]